MDLREQMVDMALSPEKREETCAPCHSPADYPQPIYPWGLCIRLENEQIDKLGLNTDVEAGDYIAFDAVGKVTSVSSRDTDKGPQKNTEIQIMFMAVAPEHEEEQPVRKPGKIDLGKFYSG